MPTRAEEDKGNALHVIEELIRSLKRAEDHAEEEEEEDGGFRLGNDFRSDSGELLAMEFAVTDGVTPGENPWKGFRESKVHPDGGTTSALYSAPGPCSGASASALTVLPGAAPKISFNYAPAISLKTLSSIGDPSFFTSVCVFLEADLPGVSINAQQVAGKGPGQRIMAKLKSLPIPSVSGVSCTDCFASVGASLQISLSCTVGAIKTCHFALQTGGGILFNMNLQLTNPSVTYDTGFMSIYNTSDYTVLYDNPAALMKFSAKPTLFARMSGNLAAKGKATFSANVNTTAGLSVVATTPTSIGNIDAGLSGHVSLQKPTFTSTLQITDSNLDIYLTPLVVWKIELGKTLSVLGKQTGFALKFEVGTAFTASYNFLQKSLSASASASGSGSAPSSRNLYASTRCASTSQLTATASMQSIQAETFLACPSSSSTPSSKCIYTPVLSKPISSGDIPAYQSLPAENCLSGPQWPTSRPTFTPAPSTPSAIASVDANNLATGAAAGQLSPSLLALCVLAPLLLLLFSFICMRNWCKKHQENALPSCVPLYWRVALADCFVSLRVGERAHLEERRRVAEERERQRAESALGKFSLGAAYSRPNSTVDQEAPPATLLAATAARQDAIPNPLIGGVPISRLPPPLLVPHGPIAAGAGFPAPPPPPAKDLATPTPGPEL